jgi:phage terminase small subunit
MAQRIKPNAMKVLAGTDQPSRMRYEAAMELAGYPRPPAELIGPEAAAAWTTMIDALSPHKILAKADLMPLLHFCNLHQALLNKWAAGETPTAADITAFRLMANEFGVTPASRSKATPVPGASEESGNPFAKVVG